MTIVLPFATCYFLLCSSTLVKGFTISYTSRGNSPLRLHNTSLRANQRYGPPSSSVDDNSNNKDVDEDGTISKQEVEFRNLLDSVMQATDPQHIPSLLTNKMELIFSLSSTHGVAIVENILKEAVVEYGTEGAEAYAEAIELILTFAENFVEAASSMDQHNKELLGKIIRTMSDQDMVALSREECLDALMVEEKENFTAGFLRHLEGECQRIAGAPTMTKESTRLLDILRTIQTRILEELGRDLGEAAQVLSQLISYDSDSERQAVLDAGLRVRGEDYAKEMLKLTEEALRGFRRVNADADLVKRVEQIDNHIRDFLDCAPQQPQATP